MELSRTDILEIIKLVEEYDLDYFEMRSGDTSLVLRRRSGFEVPPSSDEVEVPPSSGEVEVPPSSGDQDPSVEAPSGAASDATAAADQEGESSRKVEIRAPVVGMFYRRPEPGTGAFVELGGSVVAGETLALIEVMKMFSSVTAPVGGRVTKILADDGDFVEYDQVIFVLAPDE